MGAGTLVTMDMMVPSDFPVDRPVWINTAPHFFDNFVLFEFYDASPGEPFTLIFCSTLVNVSDYDDFQSCLSGPAAPILMPDCACSDFDHDSDVDLSDMAQFEQSLTHHQCTSREDDCYDGVDNDCDGAIDCDDIDCDYDPACGCGATGEPCTRNDECCSFSCDDIEEQCH